MSHSVADDPLFGVTLTLLFYLTALGLHRKWKWLHPLFVTGGGLIAMFVLLDIPYESYRQGGDLITFMLGPATVALGIPLYKQASRIRKRMAAILGGITVGSLSAIISSAVLVWLLGGTKELMLTMIPKSVTTPISVEIVRQLGGEPELAAVLTVLTGLLGSMVGPQLLRIVGIRDDIPLGVAIGTSSHGIGTARVLRESELAGGVSGFSMAVAGIVTSICMIPFIN